MILPPPVALLPIITYVTTILASMDDSLKSKIDSFYTCNDWYIIVLFGQGQLHGVCFRLVNMPIVIRPNENLSDGFLAK